MCIELKKEVPPKLSAYITGAVGPDFTRMQTRNAA